MSPPPQEKRLKFLMIKKLKVRNVPPPPSGMKGGWIGAGFDKRQIGQDMNWRQMNSAIVCGNEVLSVKRSVG